MSSYLVAGAPVLSLGGPERDAKIDALEASMRAAPSGPLEIEIIDHFAPGIYAREMRVPAGRLITSRVHRHENLSILSKGRMALYLDDGRVVEVSAGFHVLAPAGARRVAWVLEDSVWTCFHNTDERDTAKIMDEFTCSSRAEFLEHQGDTLCLG